jgi:leucyl aminopeptidase
VGRVGRVPGDDVILDPPVSSWQNVAVVEEAFAGSAARRPAEAALVVPVASSTGSGAAVRAALDALRPEDAGALAGPNPSSDGGVVTEVVLPPGGVVPRVVFVGVDDGTDHGWRAAGASAGRATRADAAAVHAVGNAVTAAALAAYVEGAVLGGWVPPRWTSRGATSPRAHRQRRAVLVGGPDGAARETARAVIRAHAQVRARTLGATPSNIKSPVWMARQARTLARRTGLVPHLWDEHELRRDGFGGLLAVGGGSATPPRLVRLDYCPDGVRGGPRVVLVGKGITFDTGGLQVKPAAGMLGMNTDMSGAAVVLAVLAACRALNVRVRVSGLLALAENAISGSAYRPGDVVTQFGGRTVEIENTDAEGRIVLADALAYADAHLDPDVVIDIATLTGAARIALGRGVAPVFSTDDALCRALVASGETTGETLWRMPLATAYRRDLDSHVADLTHIAPRAGAGAVTAALFLREFVGKRPWAHLDIAGAGRSDVDAGIAAKGATGFATRLLLRWLEDLG